jgi:integrase
MPLTDIAITRKAKPGPTPVKLCDSHGLYLLVAPSGLKSWRYNYRHQGKQKTIVLGEYPAMSLHNARVEHQRLRDIVKAGNDPMEERRLTKLLPSDGDSFAAIYAEWHKKMSQTWSANHAKSMADRFEKDLIPDLGPMKMGDITAPILLGVLQKIEKRGALFTVKRARENVGTLFRYAIRTGRCRHDPSLELRGAFVGHVQKHRAAIVDPDGVADLLRATWEYTGSFVVRQALRLSALLALRPGEIRKLEWSEVDFEAAEIRIPAAKMKMKSPHIVPLAPQAIAILQETQELTGRGRHVFPSARNPRGDRPMSEAAVAAALNRLGYQNQQSAHGFRSVFCSLLNEAGHFNPDAIERQLAHQERDKVRAAYLHTQYLPERRRMMVWWANYCDELRTGKQRRGKVVKFPG